MSVWPQSACVRSYLFNGILKRNKPSVHIYFFFIAYRLRPIYCLLTLVVLSGDQSCVICRLLSKTEKQITIYLNVKKEKEKKEKIFASD